MRFVTIGGQELDADKVDSIFAQACTVCGWHIYIKAKMSGGNELQIGELYWDTEWGEYGADPAHKKGREAVNALMADLARQLERRES